MFHATTKTPVTSRAYVDIQRAFCGSVPVEVQAVPGPLLHAGSYCPSDQVCQSNMAYPSLIHGLTTPRRSRLPRMSRLLARTTASDMRTRTYCTIVEYCFRHFFARRAAIRFSALRASWPAMPSTEYTSGVKSLRCWRQGSRYLSFFSFSWAARTLRKSLPRAERAAVSVIWTSKMANRPLCQKPWQPTVKR